MEFVNYTALMTNVSLHTLIGNLVKVVSNALFSESEAERHSLLLVLLILVKKLVFKKIVLKKRGVIEG